jgi:hypothetical protein
MPRPLRQRNLTVLKNKLARIGQQIHRQTSFGIASGFDCAQNRRCKSGTRKQTAADKQSSGGVGKSLRDVRSPKFKFPFEYWKFGQGSILLSVLARIMAYDAQESNGYYDLAKDASTLR